MDIPRPQNRRKQIIRRATLGGLAGIALVAATIALGRLEPASPSVSRASIWVDTVREGEMLRQVRGPGVLVPREIRWIAAQSDGRVERILVRPGAAVEPDTVLVELTNPDLFQQAEEARFQLEAAEAEHIELQLRLRNQQLDQRASLAVARAEYEGARLQAEAEGELVRDGIVSQLQYRRSELLAERLQVIVEIEEERLAQFAESMQAQLTSHRARVEQARNTYQRRSDRVDALTVRAGIAGVLQQVPVEEGQQVNLGANVARIARPDDLQAELRINETQARDVQLGQRVAVDTRNGIVEGRVMRIDPAVQAGTVQVDVELLGELPLGARPDLSVDGVVEIERLENVVFTGRPAFGQANSSVSLFKLDDSGRAAVRVPVQLGRTSVNAIEIVQGLMPGEQIILSDTSAWDRYDRLRIQ